MRLSSILSFLPSLSRHLKAGHGLLLTLSRWSATCSGAPEKYQYHPQRLALESLEDRTLLSGYLLVNSAVGPEQNIPRYDGETGAFIDVFIDSSSGGKSGKYPGMEVGANGDLYVCKSLSGFGESGTIQHHDPKTGAYLDTLVPEGSGG